MHMALRLSEPRVVSWQMAGASQQPLYVRIAVLLFSSGLYFLHALGLLQALCTCDSAFSPNLGLRLLGGCCEDVNLPRHFQVKSLKTADSCRASWDSVLPGGLSHSLPSQLVHPTCCQQGPVLDGDAPSFLLPCRLTANVAHILGLWLCLRHCAILPGESEGSFSLHPFNERQVGENSLMSQAGIRGLMSLWHREMVAAKNSAGLTLASQCSGTEA